MLSTKESQDTSQFGQQSTPDGQDAVCPTDPRCPRSSARLVTQRTGHRGRYFPGDHQGYREGKTDVRLSTLRKLAKDFTAHGVEFVATGPWTGVVIKNKAGVGQSKLRRSELIKSPGNAEVAEEGLHIDEIGENGDETLQAGVAFNGLAL